jgi:hypothetical protein
MLRNTEIFKISTCEVYGGKLAVGQFFFSEYFVFHCQHYVTFICHQRYIILVNDAAVK